MVNEHRERKRNERPQVPRKARKMSAAKMESAMEELGVTIQNKEDVRFVLFPTSGHPNIFQCFPHDFSVVDALRSRAFTQRCKERDPETEARRIGGETQRKSRSLCVTHNPARPVWNPRQSGTYNSCCCDVIRYV